MDYIELNTLDDISRFKELVESNVYNILMIKIVYNPSRYSIRDIEEIQQILEKYFKEIPISFSENIEENRIKFVFGIE